MKAVTMRWGFIPEIALLSQHYLLDLVKNCVRKSQLSVLLQFLGKLYELGQTGGGETDLEEKNLDLDTGKFLLSFITYLY